MRGSHQINTKLLTVILSLGSLSVFAQDQTLDNKSTAMTEASPDKSVSVGAANNKSDEKSAVAQPAKKMVQDATINLQTTITGNQEQPRVLYILPWQSPQTADVDFEPLENQQKAIFGHVEREELRRELESSGELESFSEPTSNESK